MAEWWTYRPSDFLMFSASSYASLLERYHRDTWPLPLAMLAIGAGLVVAALRPTARTARWGTLVLAGTWTWVGWGFLWSRFAEINTAAVYLAMAFAVQAVLLAAAAWQAPRFGAPPPVHWPATALIAAAVLLWPLAATQTGRSVWEVEVFGLAPEPTALATLGWLMAARTRHRAGLALVPAVTLALGIGMLWLLYGPEGAAGG